MRGILNSGHRRSSATIVRIDAGREPRPFRTWSPKVIALIGSLPETLADRSIVIRLQRKRREETIERLRFDGLERLRNLRAQVFPWAQKHLEHLRAADPEMPPHLHDRAADNWRPLLAIADLAGGPWPARARSAAVQLSGSKGDAETPAAALLADIREVFKAADVPESSREYWWRRSVQLMVHPGRNGGAERP
jgi:putative DNA primase/helicase